MAPMLAGLPLALLALLGRLWWGSWLAPGALFALYWTAGIFLPLALAPEDRVGAGAVLWVVAAGIAVFVGALLGGGPHAGQRSALESSQPRYGPLRSEVARYAWLAGWCTLLGLGAGILALVSAGFTLKTVFAIERLVVVAHAFSVARYGFDYRPPLVSQALLMFAYAAPLFGGVLAATRVRRGHLWLALLTLLPALAITVTQTTKASTIAAVVMWLSAYFATRLACGQPEVFTRRHVTGGASALGGMVVLFLVVGLARLGSVNLARLATDVLPGFKVSALGYLPAFSTWLGAAGFDLRVPSLGVYTFAGPFELLGVKRRLAGLFADVVTLSSGVTTNVYSVFRLLIEDYTAPGAWLVLTLLGLAGGAAYRQVSRGRTGLLPLLVAVYTTILYSSISSLWAYNSIIAAFIVFALGLALARRRTGPAGRAVRAPMPPLR